MTLVEPAVPNGTPAISTTRSPPCAIRWRKAIRLPFSTISSKLWTSREWTGWTPHSSPIRRAVVSDGLIASSGTAGRSRAMRRAVEPELV